MNLFFRNVHISNFQSNSLIFNLEFYFLKVEGDRSGKLSLIFFEKA